MIKCSDCRHPILKEMLDLRWLALMHFLEFLLTEEQITEKTYDNMIDRLMDFKEFAFESQKPISSSKK